METNLELIQIGISDLRFQQLQLERELKATELYKQLEEINNQIYSEEARQVEEKERIRKQMEEKWIKKIELQNMTITLKNNPPALKIKDETLVPSEYKTTKTIIEIEKAKIKEDLKNWKEVFGCELTQWNSLLITPKS